jgi:hypothetical protein
MLSQRLVIPSTTKEDLARIASELEAERAAEAERQATEATQRAAASRAARSASCCELRARLIEAGVIVPTEHNSDDAAPDPVRAGPCLRLDDVGRASAARSMQPGAKPDRVSVPIEYRGPE